MPAITKKAVDEMAQNSIRWDDKVPGFGVRRQTRHPVYLIKYRIAGRQRWHVIGKHGVFTPDTARREARRLLGLIATGQDPAAQKVEAVTEAGDTVGKLAAAYIAWAAGELRPGSLEETRRHLMVNWAPLHGQSIYGLRRRQVAERIREIETAHGRVTAGNARAQLSAMFNWAIREGYEIEANPVAGTNRPTGKSRDRVLSDTELAAVWHAAGELGAYGRIVRVLILTGQRRSEVGRMTWEEISGDVWTLPGTRTKNGRSHSIPLMPEVLALLGPRATGLVFPGLGWASAKVRLNELVPAVPHFVLHDLRRTFRTGLANLGVIEEVSEAAINHVRGGIVDVYNKARYEREVRSALGRWSAHVAKVVG